MNKTRLACLREMIAGVDYVLGTEFDSASELQRSAAALEVVGLFFSRVKPEHAKRFFDLGQALGDIDHGSHPPILAAPKTTSAPNPTQIEWAKAEVALALEAKVKAGKSVKTAARELVRQYPEIKALAGSKFQHNGTWEDTIAEWRKSLSAPSRKKNLFAEMVFVSGREVIGRLSKRKEMEDIERRCAERAARVGVFVGRSNTPRGGL